MQLVDKNVVLPNAKAKKEKNDFYLKMLFKIIKSTLITFIIFLIFKFANYALISHNESIIQAQKIEIDYQNNYRKLLAEPVGKVSVTYQGIDEIENPLALRLIEFAKREGILLPNGAFFSPEVNQVGFERVPNALVLVVKEDHNWELFSYYTRNNFKRYSLDSFNYDTNIGLKSFFRSDKINLKGDIWYIKW